jgi:triphosphoribosyl-dephospho-CoA synthase
MTRRQRSNIWTISSNACQSNMAEPPVPVTAGKERALALLRARVRPAADRSYWPQSPLDAAWTGQAEAIRLACVWEAAAPKVGNVHPEAAFDDCDFADFCAAAAQIAPLLAGQISDSGQITSDQQEPSSTAAGLGDRVLSAIQATRAVTGANVNLGIVLLIAPLAMADSRGEVAGVLAALTPQDGAKVYQGIALAGPGGIQSDPVDPRWDVSAAAAPAAIDLIAAMRLASDRDRIARQYAHNFTDFFEQVVPVVEAELDSDQEIGEAIVRAQLRLLADQPDSLIARKCGAEVALEASRRAAACRTADGRWDRSARVALDRWMRQQSNRRNPGTTADLVAAALYWLIQH